MPVAKRPKPSRSGLLTTLACGPAGEPMYALEGSVFVGGAAIQWLRDGLGILKTAAESETLARSLAGNDGVYMVPAFTGLGAPYWNAEARGAMVGLTRGNTRAHLARAALEAIAYQSREVVDAIARDTGTRLREVRVDGGAAANDFLMQFQADQLGVSVNRPKVVETTAMGAAFLAGLGVGLWKSTQLEKMRLKDRVFAPEMKKSQRESLFSGWQAAVKRVL